MNVPPERRHERLRKLSDLRQQRPLRSYEWSEVAEHLAALGRTEEAARAKAEAAKLQLPRTVPKKPPEPPPPAPRGSLQRHLELLQKELSYGDEPTPAELAELQELSDKAGLSRLASALRHPYPERRRRSADECQGVLGFLSALQRRRPLAGREWAMASTCLERLGRGSQSRMASELAEAMAGSDGPSGGSKVAPFRLRAYWPPEGESALTRGLQLIGLLVGARLVGLFVAGVVRTMGAAENSAGVLSCNWALEWSFTLLAMVAFSSLVEWVSGVIDAVLEAPGSRSCLPVVGPLLLGVFWVLVNLRHLNLFMVAVALPAALLVPPLLLTVFASGSGPICLPQGDGWELRIYHGDRQASGLLGQLRGYVVAVLILGGLGLAFELLRRLVVR